MRRRGCAALGLGVCAALLASGAWAQGGAAAPRKPKRPAVTAPAAPPSDGTPPTQALTTPPLPGARLLHVSPSASSAPTLRSAVRSRWSGTTGVHASTQASCRAQCAETRLSCRVAEADDPPSRCDAAWTGCLSTCGGLTYGRAAPDGR